MRLTINRLLSLILSYKDTPLLVYHVYEEIESMERHLPDMLYPSEVTPREKAPT